MFCEYLNSGCFILDITVMTEKLNRGNLVNGVLLFLDSLSKILEINTEV